MEGILRKLFENSKTAINDGIYDIKENLSQSNQDFIKIIKENQHATLITEIKFSSPSLGEIKKKSDPVGIAKSMIDGGAKALSILTQPHLFSGDPENKCGCVSMDNAFAPPSIIDFAIPTGSDFFLISPNDGEENFISVIRVAC